MRLDAYERKVVVGVSGAGKSHHVKSRIVAKSQRIVIWDPKGEYPRDCDGVERVDTVELARRLDADDGGALRLAVVVDWNDPDELCEEFCVFAALMKTARDLVLVVDEIALLTGGAAGALVMLAVLSREWEMPLVMVAQRAVSIPKTARAQVSWLVAFRQTDADDIDALARLMGDEKAARIAKLPRWQSVQWRESEAFES